MLTQSARSFYLRTLFLVSGIFVSSLSYGGDDAPEGFDFTLSGQYGAGRMENPSVNAAVRDMGIWSVNLLPGYRFGKYLIGLNFEYTWNTQFSSLGKGNGVNWRGSTFLLGVGGTWMLSDYFYLGGAFDFIGSYTFSNPTSLSEQASLNGPLGFHLQVGFFPSYRVPVSIDLKGQYMAYQTLTIEEQDTNSTSKEWSMRLGATWHFGKPIRVEELPIPEELTTIQIPVVPHDDNFRKNQEKDLAEWFDTESTKDGFEFYIQNTVFDPGTSSFQVESQEKLMEAAYILARNPTQKILIESYPHSANPKPHQMDLALSRAKALQKFFKSNGLDQSKISVVTKKPRTIISREGERKTRELIDLIVVKTKN